MLKTTSYPVIHSLAAKRRKSILVTFSAVALLGLALQFWDDPNAYRNPKDLGLMILIGSIGTIGWHFYNKPSDRSLERALNFYDSSGHTASELAAIESSLNSNSDLNTLESELLVADGWIVIPDKLHSRRGLIPRRLIANIEVNAAELQDLKRPSIDLTINLSSGKSLFLTAGKKEVKVLLSELQSHDAQNA